MKDAEFLKQNGVDVEKSLELFGDMDTYNETIKEFQVGIPKKIAEIEKYYNEKDMENYLQYVLESSEYANTVKNFNSAWIMYKPEVFGSSLGNFKILRYEEYSDTQVLAEVSFDYIVELQYSTETYHSNYKIILIKTENGWKIANMENI